MLAKKSTNNTFLILKDSYTLEKHTHTHVNLFAFRFLFLALLHIGHFILFFPHKISHFNYNYHGFLCHRLEFLQQLNWKKMKNNLKIYSMCSTYMHCWAECESDEENVMGFKIKFLSRHLSLKYKTSCLGVEIFQWRNQIFGFL